MEIFHGYENYLMITTQIYIYFPVNPTQNLEHPPNMIIFVEIKKTTHKVMPEITPLK